MPPKARAAPKKKNTANSANSTSANSANSASNIIAYLFKLQVATKMFHWQTTSYAAHVDTGALYDKIVDLTDEIIEQYMGVYGRPTMTANASVSVPNMTRAQMMSMLRDGIRYLTTRMPRDSHIQNLRDELTGAMAQALYLLTME